MENNVTGGNLAQLRDGSHRAESQNRQCVHGKLRVERRAQTHTEREWNDALREGMLCLAQNVRLPSSLHHGPVRLVAAQRETHTHTHTMHM